MKRISILVTVVALAPAVGRASCWSSQRHQIIYSPYAFSYNNPGLIPGSIQYFALCVQREQRRPGLRGARLYAVRLQLPQPRLVVDYYWWQMPCCPPCRVVEACPAPRGAVSPAARDTARRPHEDRRRGPEDCMRFGKTDVKHIVRRYLQADGLGRISVSTAV